MSKEIILSRKLEEETTISEDMRYFDALYNWAERMERSVKYQNKN